MGMRLRLLSSALVTGLIAGCADQPVRTHIVSEPPGARIEVNGAYMGTAPVDVTLPQKSEHHRLRDMARIVAVPAEPGQYQQEKTFFYHQPAPVEVLFDMTKQPWQPTPLPPQVAPPVPPPPAAQAPAPAEPASPPPAPVAPAPPPPSPTPAPPSQ